MATAILIDGGFFLNGIVVCRPKPTRQNRKRLALDVSSTSEAGSRQAERLYRIFFYDCPPLAKKVNPVSGLAIDFAKTPTDEISQDDVKYEVRRRVLICVLALTLRQWRTKRQVDQLILGRR